MSVKTQELVHSHSRFMEVIEKIHQKHMKECRKNEAKIRRVMVEMRSKYKKALNDSCEAITDLKRLFL
jgi:uncharacterized protein YpuA (DUF1002 family)